MTGHAPGSVASDGAALPDPVGQNLQGRAWKFGGLLDVDFEICSFRLAADLAAGSVENSTTGARHRFEPLPEFLLEMITAGGLYPYLRARHAAAGIG